jgi:predicted nucleic acid-binding protein
VQWVVDASVALAWVFDAQEPERNFAAHVLSAQQAGTIELCAPAVFHAEITYQLTKTGRAKRLKSIAVIEQAELIASAIAHTDHLANADCVTLTRFAMEHHVQGYDAHYLALAMLRGVGLATLDKGLASACRRAGVALYSV